MFRSALHAKHDPGFAGLGKSIREVIVVVVVTVVCVSIAFAVTRTRYWAVLGLLVPIAQAIVVRIVLPNSVRHRLAW